MRELSEHVLDIARNSLEAGARTIRIEVVEDAGADRLTIRVSDDGRGMGAEEVRRAPDPFHTTRTTRRVGLGIPFLAEAARACLGDIEIRSRPGEGATVTAWLQASHVDRQPVGNIAATLVTLIVSAPEVNLEYRHQVDEREFTFSAAEARREAGGLPLSHPAVAQWLSAFLDQQIRALRDHYPQSAPAPATRPRRL